MHPTLRALLSVRGGVVSRDEVLAAVDRHVLEHALAAGHVVRPHPRVFADPARVHEASVRLRAALLYAGPAAASHTTGLAVWGLAVLEDAVLHVAASSRVDRREGRHVRVHQWRGFRPEPPLVLVRRGVPVVALERCLVDAWPLLPEGAARRAPLIDAVNQRLTTPARVQAALAHVPKLTGRAALRDLLARLDAGCRSELELWGHDQVFRGRAFAGAVRQHRVRLPSSTVYVDLAFPDLQVAVELDGAAWHGSAQQRERDVQRDAALAALGWLVLRFTSRRLHAAPEAVQAEVLAVLARRREQLRAA